jgi:hypothetical protein
VSVTTLQQLQASGCISYCDHSVCADHLARHWHSETITAVSTRCNSKSSKSAKLSSVLLKQFHRLKASCNRDLMKFKAAHLTITSSVEQLCHMHK